MADPTPTQAQVDNAFTGVGVANSWTQAIGASGPIPRQSEVDDAVRAHPLATFRGTGTLFANGVKI